MISSRDANGLNRVVTAIGKPGAVKLQTKLDRLYPEKGSKYIEAFEQRKE